jgi:hypothetical protein
VVDGVASACAVGTVIATNDLAGIILVANSMTSRTTCARPAVQAPALAMTSRTTATRPRVTLSP